MYIGVKGVITWDWKVKQFYIVTLWNSIKELEMNFIKLSKKCAKQQVGQGSLDLISGLKKKWILFSPSVPFSGWLKFQFVCEEMITISYLTALTTYFNYGLLFSFNQFREFFFLLFHSIINTNILFSFPSTIQGYALVYLGLEDFYIYRMYLSIQVLHLFLFSNP